MAVRDQELKETFLRFLEMCPAYRFWQVETRES